MYEITKRHIIKVTEQITFDQLLAKTSDLWIPITQQDIELRDEYNLEGIENIRTTQASISAYTTNSPNSKRILSSFRILGNPMADDQIIEKIGLDYPFREPYNTIGDHIIDNCPVIIEHGQLVDLGATFDAKEGFVFIVKYISGDFAWYNPHRSQNLSRFVGNYVIPISIPVDKEEMLRKYKYRIRSENLQSLIEE